MQSGMTQTNGSPEFPGRFNLLELNYGNAEQAPTMFIHTSIRQGLDKANNGGGSFR